MQRPSVHTGHRLPRGGDRCDFCGAAQVIKLYACRDFEWEGHSVFGQEVGRWAACSMCALFIDDRKWARISLRVMSQVAKRKNITEDQLQHMEQAIRVLHRTFGSHMIQGEALSVLLPKYTRLTGTCGE